MSNDPPANVAIDYVFDDGDLSGPLSTTGTITIGITAVNDPPTLTGDLLATVDEGGSYALTALDLGFADADDVAAGVTFTVSDLVHGIIRVKGQIQNTFTGTQLQSGLVVFEHDGTEPAASGFNVSVEDGNEDLSPPIAQAFAITVNPVNDAPVLTGDCGAVLEGQSVVISAADLGFTDPYDGPDDVTFTTLNHFQGEILVEGIVATSFTGTQLANGDVAFRHDGSELASAGFDVSLEDGNEDGSVPDFAAFSIAVTAVNDAPVLTGDLSATVNEGETYAPIGLSDLGFTDPDDIGSGVTFTVSNLVNGEIRVNGFAQNSFTGDQVSGGNVSFHHNGTETLTAGFNVSVEDGNEDGSAPIAQAFSITVNPVNDPPVLTGDLAATVAEGGSYVLTSSDLGFTDPDDGPGDITFTTSDTFNGVILVGGIAASSFTGTQLAAGQVAFQHDGSETLTADFSVSVEDGNQDLSNPASFYFS